MFNLPPLTIVQISWSLLIISTSVGHSISPAVTIPSLLVFIVNTCSSSDKFLTITFFKFKTIVVTSS